MPNPVEENKFSPNEDKRVISFAATIQPINLKSTNLANEWKNWSKQFKIFLRASNLEGEPDARKVALLLHHLGPDSLQIFNSFNEDIDVINYNELVSRFESYFVPKSNIAMERHNFFMRQQSDVESISEYAAALHNLSSTCAFGNIREELVRDIFICGLSETFTKIRERLLSEGDICLDKALDIAKSMERAKRNAHIISQPSDHDLGTVAVLNRQRSRPQSKGAVPHVTSNTRCNKCGQSHKNKCPAYGAKCHACGKLNHFAKFCFSNNRTTKIVKKVDKQGKDDNDDYDGGSYDDAEDDDLFVGVLESRAKMRSPTSNEREWNIIVNVLGNDLKCQVDTGAQANIISLDTFKSLNLSKFTKNVKNNILTFSGEKLPVLGVCYLSLLFKGEFYSTIFYIIDMQCNSVIGLQTAVDMKLVHKVNVVNLINKKFANYSNVFEGLGLLKNQCSLKVNSNIQPVVDPPRKIPFTLHESLKKELNRMVNLNVITPVREPTEWVSSIVLVTKPNGSIRVCLDPKNLNKAILRPRFSFPNIDECKSKLSGSRIFSTMDASSGFWMIPLDEKSPLLADTDFYAFHLA